MGSKTLVKNTLVFGITLLFIISAVTPLAIGDSIRVKDEAYETVSDSSIRNSDPEFEFIRKYGLNHLLYSVVQTNDGGYVFAGSEGPRGGKLGFVLKTDAFGKTEWSKTVGEIDINGKYFNSIKQTTDGGFIITGNTDYDWATWCNIWLVKLDSNGVEEWSKVLCNGRGYSIQQTFDGGYMIGGDDFPYIPALLIKTDSNGNIVWEKKFGGGPGATIWSVIQALDGGYVASGHELDAFVLKTNDDGNLLWEKTLRIHEFDGKARSIDLTKDGNYIVAGTGWNDSINGENGFLVKIDDNGTIEWDVTIGGSSLWDYIVFDVDHTSEGGYIVAGLKHGGPGPNLEFYCLLIKTDDCGNKEWEMLYGNPIVYYDGFHSVQQTNDGGYVVAGSLIWYMGQGLRRAILVKVAPENQVNIIKPKNGLYILNQRILPFIIPIIIGSIDIRVDTSNIEFDVEGVEFYVDGKWKYTDTSEPFIWTWDNTTRKFKHTIETVAFDSEGNRGGKVFSVIKVN